MVQLEQLGSSAGDTSGFFQFHYGSIRTSSEMAWT